MSEKRAATLTYDYRAEGQRPVLRGYAAVYDTEATIGGLFRERIARGAFDEALAGDDVRALFNHDPNQILGRTLSGTLRLTTDDVGLAYEIDIDTDDPLAMRVWRSVQRGDVSQSSFGFEVRGQEWSPTDTASLPLRTITKVSLFDVSPVTYPAYAETSVTARDLPNADAEAAAVLAQKAAADAAAEDLQLTHLRERCLVAMIRSHADMVA